jgi:hypothetical protein
MRHENITITTPTGIDWKGLGYVVSIVSVFFLGAIAWPGPEDPRWHLPALVAGMVLSIVGMGLRYLAHLKQQKEMARVEAEARRQS